MKFRTFVLIPVAITLVLLSLHSIITPLASWGVGLDVVSLVVKALAMVGGVLAARAFGRGPRPSCWPT